MFMVLGIARTGFGQKPISVTPDYAPRPWYASANDTPPPQQAPRAVFCSPSPAPSSSTATPAVLRSAKIEHLLKAAEHLELAGLHKEALKTRGQADREKAAAAGDIRALQAEIERLRSITQHTSQVLLKLRVVELSPAKLRKLGFESSRMSNGLVKQNGAGNAIAPPTIGNIGLKSFSALAPNDPFFSLLDALCADGSAKVLAEPTLVTVSNRAASYRSGGEIPFPTLQGNSSASLEIQGIRHVNRFHPRGSGRSDHTVGVSSQNKRTCARQGCQVCGDRGPGSQRSGSRYRNGTPVRSDASARRTSTQTNR